MGERRTLHTFFPTVIQVTDFPDREALNQRLRAATLELMERTPNTRPEDWSGQVYTTIGAGLNLLAEPPFSELQSLVQQELGRYLEALAIDASQGVRVSEAWVNVYSHGHSQEIHHHANSVVSGIYYIAAPPGASSVMFHSPVADNMLEPPKLESNPLNSLAVFVPAVEGRLVLFRSYVKHSVPASEIEGLRMSLAFNVQL